MGILNINNITGITKFTILGGYLQTAVDYFARVLADSGLIVSKNATNDLYNSLPQQSSIQFGWVGVAGSKKRTSTVWSWFTKLYSMFTTNDATQTTESLQPYVGGNIAPNENEGIKNIDTDFINYPEISFADNEAWSFTMNFNWFGKDFASLSSLLSYSIYRIYFSQQFDQGVFGFRIAGPQYLSLGIPSPPLVGKNSSITVTYDGIGTISSYLNGVFVDSYSKVTTFVFSSIFSESSTVTTQGQYNAHIIHSTALTPTEVETMHSDFTNLYPEIPSVQIGTQEWATSNFEAVATPMGNVIPEVQEGSNVLQNVSDCENFGYDTFDGVSSSGFHVIGSTGAGAGTAREIDVIAGQYVKVTFDASLTSGFVPLLRLRVSLGSTTISQIVEIVDGSNTLYFLTTTTTICVVNFYTNFAAEYTISNLVTEKVGWSGSQDLYDGLIAQGESVYDATKAAAMWCYYNNDLATGAIYGKLYNWFAVSLLQQDIDLYNASNPDWGWHVPTEAEFTALQTALGGASVAGGKMKMVGTDYWASPNTGADNSSGFTAIANGRRFNNGIFSYLNTRARLTSISSQYQLRTDNIELASVTFNEINGCALRLIKD